MMYYFKNGVRTSKMEYSRMNIVGAHKLSLSLGAALLNKIPGPKYGQQSLMNIKNVLNHNSNLRAKTFFGNQLDTKIEKAFIKILENKYKGVTPEIWMPEYTSKYA